MGEIYPVISIPLRYKLNRTPKIAMVDLLSPKKVDIDGDGKPCISHRDSVKGIINALLPEARVKVYDIKPPDKFPDRSLTEGFEHLFKKIQAGEEFDVITTSLGLKLGFDYLVAMTQLPLTLDNVGDYRNQIREIVLDMAQYRRRVEGTPWWLPEEEIIAIEKVIKMGIPVCTSGSSSGHDMFNFTNFTNGGINVGTLDAQGEFELSCSTHTIIDRYTRGVYNLYPVEDGYSIYKDGPCIFSKENTSGGEPFVEDFVGRHIGDLLATREDIELYKKCANPKNRKKIDFSPLSRRMFTHSQVSEIYLDYNKENPRWRNHRDYLAFNNDGNIYYFKVDSDGYVYYDPDNSRQKGAVSKLSGCSYASPTMAVLIAIEKCGNLLN